MSTPPGTPAPTRAPSAGGRDVTVVVTGAVLLALLTLHRIDDPDLGWVLRTGEVVLGGDLPRREEWSWTAPGEAFRAHAWGASAALAALVRGLGLVPGALAWQALLIAGTLALVAIDGVRRRVAPARVLTACFALTVGLLVFASPRTTLAGWPFLVLEGLWWAAAARGQVRREPAWLLVGLQALWVNLHGTAALGVLLPLGVAAAALLARDTTPGLRRECLRRSGWRVLGQLLTPYGVAGAAHVLVVVGRSTANIAEYQSPDLHSPGVLCTVTLTLGLVAWLWHRRPGWYALAASGLALSGLVSARYLSVALLLTAPALVDLVASLGPPVRRRISTAALVVLAVSGLGGALRAVDRPLSAEVLPLGPARWLAENPQPGRPLVNPYTAGGWLSWTAQHGERVAQDGRNDVYPPAVLDALDRAYDVLPGWGVVVDPDAGLTVVVQRESALADRLADDSADWRRVYADEDWAVYEPVRPATVPLPVP